MPPPSRRRRRDAVRRLVPCDHRPARRRLRRGFHGGMAQQGATPSPTAGAACGDGVLSPRGGGAAMCAVPRGLRREPRAPRDRLGLAPPVGGAGLAGPGWAAMTHQVTNRAALAPLEDIEARRLANEELAAATTDVIDQAVYGNRAEAYKTALRIVARALPRIIAEAQRLPVEDWTEAELRLA